MSEKRFLFGYKIINETNYSLLIGKFLLIICVVGTIILLKACTNSASSASEKLYEIEPEQYYIVGKTIIYNTDNEKELFYIATKEKINENEKQWVYDYKILPLNLLTKTDFKTGDRITLKYTNNKFQQKKNPFMKESYIGAFFILMLVSVFTCVIMYSLQ